MATAEVHVVSQRMFVNRTTRASPELCPFHPNTESRPSGSEVATDVCQSAAFD